MRKLIGYYSAFVLGGCVPATDQLGPADDGDGAESLVDEEDAPDGDDDDAPERDEAASAGDGGGGFEAECGNGVAEVHESCDDANDVDADGCNVDCRISGSVIWSRTHDGEASEDDTSLSITVLPDGDAIAVGSAMAAEGSVDGWIRRYDAEGSVVWIERPALENGRGKAGLDNVAAVAIDRDGFIVACGTMRGVKGQDAWVRRYSDDGVLDWHTSESGANRGGFDACSGIATAADGRIAVTGTRTGVDDRERDIWAASLNSLGSVVWSETAGAAGIGDEQGKAVAIDGDGRTIVAGSIATAGGSDRDVWAGAWSFLGSAEWTFASGDVTNGGDEARGIVLHADSILVVGRFATDAGHRGFYSRPVTDQMGALQMHESARVESIESIAIDGSGNAVLVGAIEDAQGALDIWIEKRDPQWTTLWTNQVAGAPGGDDTATDVAIGDDDVILVSGALSTEDSGLDAWVTAFAP